MAVRQPRGGIAAYLNGPQPSETYRPVSAVSCGSHVTLAYGTEAAFNRSCHTLNNAGSGAS
jgi:hypothetical protein